MTPSNLPRLFSCARRKAFSFFFLWGDPVQNCPHNPAPAGCLFSSRKSRFEVLKRGDFGEETCLVKGGVDRAKKGKKDAQKKVGYLRHAKSPIAIRKHSANAMNSRKPFQVPEFRVPCGTNVQHTRVYPYPLGAGSARPNPKMGARPENP